MVKTNVYLFHNESTPIPSLGHICISSHQLYKDLNLELPNLCLHQLTKQFSAKILPHISSVLRNLGVVVEKYIVSSSTKIVDADPKGTLNS